jgi:N-acetylglutamate synthase-like GNAT family acetyltransferase
MAILSLRPALPGDLSAIKSLVRGARINPTGLKWLRFIVAENDLGDVIGCVQIKPHRDGSQELASLVVHPQYRGQGIARSLVEYLIDTNDGDLYLMCRDSLENFYKKLGFEAITEPQMPLYFRRISRLASLAEILRKEGETLLVMQKRHP